ncbi:MAG TPA: hypothetical protein VJ851_13485 [Jatrophihabitans sp.]|nr:hypothetical protein [Jatrophihabitans sp.]
MTALLQAPVSGTVAVGTHIDQRVLNLGGVHGGVVTIIDAAVAHPTSRPRPVLLRPVRPELILDRHPIRDVAQPTSTVRELELYGETGSGKTTLLEELAWTVTDTDYPDGVVFLSLDSHQVNDALFDIWSAFYECPISFKPTDAQLRIDLKSTCALVLLDDLDLEPDAVHRIMHVLPNSRCIVAGHERRLWGEGRSIHVAGLPMEDAVPLIEHDIGRALSPDECTLAQALWHSTAGHPLRLQQSFGAVLQEAESRTERAPAVAMPADIVDEAELDQLLAGQLPGAASNLASYVESQTDQWRMAALARLSRPSPERAAPADTSVRLRLEKLLIEWALATGRYVPALRLARSTESALALCGHWDAWLEVLNRVHLAAMDASDAPTQAWALHQIGTRALCLNQLVAAESALAAALEIRTRIGDEKGAAVTRHNLGLADTACRRPVGGQLHRSIAVLAGLVVLAILALGGVAEGSQWWPFHPRPARTAGSLQSTAGSLQSSAGSLRSTAESSRSASSSLSSTSPSLTTASFSTQPPPASSTPRSTSPSTPTPPPPPGEPIIAETRVLAFSDTVVGSSNTLLERFTMRDASPPTMSVPNSSGFSIDNGCSSVEPTKSSRFTCSVKVIFTPTIAGSVTATLTAKLPDGSQTSIALSGKGILPQVTINVVNDGYLPASPVISGTGISCPGTCSVSVAEDSAVTLTASQCTNDSCAYIFAGWKSNSCSAPDFFICTLKAVLPAGSNDITVYYEYVQNSG